MEVPEYDFTRHRRSDVTRRVDPADVIIIEGILVLHMAGLRDLLSMKIYVDTGALRGRGGGGALLFLFVGSCVCRE